MTDGPTRPRLRIRLLGGFAVRVDDAPVPEEAWRLRKARSLLKLLALAPDRRMHRDRVSELLWPERDGPSAANNLHQAVYVARRALDAAGAGAGACLELSGDSLSLARGAVEVDVDAFEAAAVRARAAPTLEATQEALGLYGGELLPEDLAEHWSAARRLALREQRIGLLIDLAQLHGREGRRAAAVEIAQQAVVEAPLHEGAHRQLMRSFVADGRRQQALVQYEQLRDGLRRELEARPDPETRELFREILAEPPQLRPTRARPGAPADTGSPRSNLPLMLTSFIGRERERGEVTGLLQRSRLVTLTGPGGCGKTRLSLELAGGLRAEFADGVHLVELAPIADPALVPQQVATALGIELQSEREPAEVLAEQIADLRLLVVLDNCEHVIASAARLMERLLRACPALRVLATSREPLHVLGEVTWRVPSLALPDAGEVSDLDRLSTIEAVRLFVERAADVTPGFQLDRDNAAAIAEICLRLDGLPLALELAAARNGALTPSQMAGRLRDSFNVLGHGNRGALTRQQTLAATIDWSHELLDGEERALFRRLGVFAGLFSLEAVESICGDGQLDRADAADLLGRLVEKSLVSTSNEAGESRYRLLETVRQVAGERLAASGERAHVEERHRAFYVSLAEASDPDLGEAPGFAARLEREHDNVRAALASALAHDPEAALRLGSHSCAFWMARGYFAEGTRWLDEALAAAPARTPLRARALLDRGGLAVRRGLLDRVCSSAHEAIEILRDIGDRRALADALQQTGLLECQIGDHALGRSLLERSGELAGLLGDPSAMAAVRHCEGVIALWRGDHEAACAMLRQAFELFGGAADAVTPVFPAHGPGLVVFDDEPGRPRCTYEDTFMLFRRVSARAAAGWALSTLSVVQRTIGAFEDARVSLERALAIFEDLGDAMGASMALNAAGNLARSRGEFRLGRSRIEEAMALRRELRDRRGIAMSLCNLALLEARAGDIERAHELLGEGRAMFARTDDMPGLLIVQMNLGNLELAGGQWDRAREALERARSMALQQATRRVAGWLSITLAEGALDHGDPARSAAYLAEARGWLAPFGDARAADQMSRLTRPPGGAAASE